MSYTLGPWQAMADGDKWQVTYYTPGSTVEGEKIGNRPIVPSIENARLIAAAPELLATLKHLVHWHDQLGQDDLHRAQTTIAHAEGKEKR